MKVKLHLYRLPPGDAQIVSKRIPTDYFHIALEYHQLMYWVDVRIQGTWDIVQKFPQGQCILQGQVRVPLSLSRARFYQGRTSHTKSNVAYFRDVLSGIIPPIRGLMPDNCLTAVCGILQDMGYQIPDSIITTDSLKDYLCQTRQMSVVSQSVVPPKLPPMQGTT